MLPGLEQEVRAGLEMEGVATLEGRDAVMQWVQLALEQAALREPIEWYNDDEHLSSALAAMLRAKQQLDVGATGRVVELAKHSAEELRRWGFSPEAHTAEIAKALVDFLVEKKFI